MRLFQISKSISPTYLNVAIHKRPVLTKEEQLGELDIISTCSPHLRVHECKIKVDGITKYVETHDFRADQVFGDLSSGESIFQNSIMISL